MIESLKDLKEHLKQIGTRLYFFYGSNSEIVQECIKIFKIECIFFNKDYSPYSIKRDEQICKIANKINVVVEQCQDYYIIIPGQILKEQDRPFQKFTSFYEKALLVKVSKPKTTIFKQKDQPKKSSDYLVKDIDQFYVKNTKIEFKGGRQNVDFNRIIHLQQNTNLSSYIKFGCVSIREVYKVFKWSENMIRSLLWRDFYSAQLLFPDISWIAYSIPELNKKQKALFKAFIKGKTGFPIVDASIHNLNTTGYIQNRNRLIVGSFLINILNINWKHGEKYFSNVLIDYDVTQNNGNWRWINDQPDFKTLNPWRQQKLYDKQCIYIKKWIPELKDVEIKDIHTWYISFKKSNVYLEPIVQYY